MASLSFKEVEGRVCEALEEASSVLCKDQNEIIEEEITHLIPHELREEALEIITAIRESLEPGMSIAYSYSSYVLYVRIFDGERYVFPLPFMLDDDADMKEACINLSLYTVKELIPLIITDVPREDLDFLASIFPHIDASCYPDDDDSFFVKVNNECDLLDEIPSVTVGDLALNAITEEDAEVYADLCSDAVLNRYWGYDVSCDNPDGSRDYYLQVAEREFLDGVALTLAIRYRKEFAGEAVIYGFDYLGSASIALRVLPSFSGCGIGTLALECLIKLARSIGLSVLRTEIMNENVPSIKMTSKFMNVEKTDKCKTQFTLSL